MALREKITFFLKLKLVCLAAVSVAAEAAKVADTEDVEVGMLRNGFFKLENHQICWNNLRLGLFLVFLY